MGRVTGSFTRRETTAGRELREALDAMDGAQVWIGIRSAKDPDSEIVRYAAKNEFGDVAERVPERSFMRSTADEQAAKYGRMAGTAFKEATRAGFLQAADLLGVIAAGDVQIKITSDVPPPNAPATIRAKGSSGTLRGKTGRLLQSIGHETIPGDEVA